MSTRHTDRGATLIETALVALFLSILFVGITEYGFAWRQTTVVEKSVQQGGRAAGNGANGQFTDFEALRALRASLGSGKNLTVNYVVVYLSDADGTVPTNDCFTSSQAGLCNRYVAADLNRPAADFGCGGSDPDRFWCPTSRDRTRAPSPDYVGVHVNATYTGLTGLIPNGIEINRSAVYALEPCAFGLPDC